MRLADLLGGLTIAADLGFGLPPEEAMRSCLVATALARRMGLPEAEVAEAYYAALLSHVGCTALSHETAAAFGDERAVLGAVARANVADPADVAATVVPVIAAGLPGVGRAEVERRALEGGPEFGRMFDTGSCEVASATAVRLGLGPGIARALAEIVEWWSGDGAPRGLAGDEIARSARVARAAVDVARFDELGGPAAAVEALRRRSGVILDPEVVEGFAADAEAVVAESRAGDPRELILEVEPEPVVELADGDLRRVAAAFGDLADLKTPWTHGHSSGTARIARAAGAAAGLDGRDLERLEAAALLQDIGRVAVTDRVWEKPGPLTVAEWEQVRMHAYHSERILSSSRALAPIARDAGMHHERLDGSGYHRGCARRELSPAARMLAAADAFHAMTQARPHRPALEPERAAAALGEEARAGRLDPDAVAAVLEAAGRPPARRADGARPAGLSVREVEVARLVAAGCSNAEIANRLVISRRTAEHHVQHIYAKVGLSSRAGLALFVHEHELV